jgi:hypothetical protein
MDWDDVIMRAEVALAYHQDPLNGMIEGSTASCPFERSLAELLGAVGRMGRCLEQRQHSEREAQLMLTDQSLPHSEIDTAP